MADREQITCYICEGRINSEEGNAAGGFFLHKRYVCTRCEKAIVDLRPDCKEYDWLIGQIKKALAG